MIYATVNDAVNSISTLNILIEREMSARTAYKIARLVREITKETELFQTTQTKLAEKYWKRDEDGNVVVDENGYWHIPKENVEEYSKEINNLLTEKIEINAESLSLSDLDEAKFTPKQMQDIMAFVEE